MLARMNPLPQFEGLPHYAALAELKTRRQWVAWKYLEKDDGKLTKPPVNPHNGYGASHSDPATWGTYEQALDRAQTHNLAGVGFVLTDNDDLTGFDLDDCRDPDFGGLEPWADEIISLAETYTEVSPSGRGIRIIARGKIPAAIKCDPASVEVYGKQRYLTITGQHVPGTPMDILPAPRTLEALKARVETYKPEPAPMQAATLEPQRKSSGTISSALAQSTERGGFFKAVNSFALANLSKWVPDLFGGIAEFQQGTGAWRVSSKNLGRNLEEDLSIAPNGIVDFGVHDMGDPRLGKRTAIDLVLEYGSQHTAVDAARWLCERLGSTPESMGWGAREAPQGASQGHQAADTPEEGPVFVGDINGEPKARAWLVPDWIPAGVVSSISGDGGVGKTLLAQQLLYAAGVNGKWLGMDVPARRGLGVFCEDDIDELHRRHDAIKADLGYAIGNPFSDTWVWPRVGFDNLLVTFDKDNKPTASRFFNSILTHVLEKHIGLLILDTIADLFGGNEIIRAQVNYFIKATCGGFIQKAREAGFELTVILLAHPSQAGRNSGTGESGSTAWNNAVRARLYLTRPEEGLPEQRVLTRKKSNYSSSGDDVKVDLLWSDGVLKVAETTGDNRIAVISIEHQIAAQVHAAWEAGRPYKAKKGAPNCLDKCMVETFRSRVEMGVIVAALTNLKTTETIVVDRAGDRRGWRVPSMENMRQAYD